MEELGKLDSLSFNCMMLYLAARRSEIAIPEPEVHVYLSGVFNGFSNADASEGAFVVSSVDDLRKVIEDSRTDATPNAKPYLVSKTSGNYFLNIAAMQGFKPLLMSHPAIFYDMAAFFARKMGKKTVPSILEHIAQHTDESISLFARAYMMMPNVAEIQDSEYKTFREYYKRKIEPLIAPEHPMLASIIAAPKKEFMM